MTVTTRFNPSTNGPLHLGHIYMVLINEAYAKAAGGRFIVRFDDSHPFVIERLGYDRVMRIRDGQRETLEWMGFEPDEWVNQEDRQDEVEEIVTRRLGVLTFEDPVHTPLLVGFNHMNIFPMVPKLTAEKVVFDNLAGVTHLIRGIDLLSEYSLYAYYAEQLGIKDPLHFYLPRLNWSLGDLSKTSGAPTVESMRKNGLTPDDIRLVMSNACLRQPGNGWFLENIRERPCL